MALIRNVAGVHKLGLIADTSPDMQRMLDDGYGGGGGGGVYDYPYNGGDVYTPGPVLPDYNPDGADNVDNSGIQPVHPIEPIYGYGEPMYEPEVQPNTAQVITPESQRQVDITAVGALASIVGMALGLRPKGIMGGIMYAGACGLLWMQLHYQTPGAGNAPVTE